MNQGEFSDLWHDSQRFLGVGDYAYALNRARIDAWLRRKGLMQDCRCYAIRRLGPITLGFRYTKTRRLCRFGRTRAARSFPKIVRGWPL